LSPTGLESDGRIGSTGIMKRIGALIVVGVLAALAGCGRSGTPPSTPKTQGATPTVTVASTPTTGASATTTPSPEENFSVDGVGPYVLGASLATLQGSGTLANVRTGAEVCPQNTYAQGTGDWSGVGLAFRPDGRLYMLTNRSASLPTPSGAYIGTSLAELKKIYAQVSTQELHQGDRMAFLVTTLSSRGILFDLDPSQRVLSMSAADAQFLKTSFTTGTDFC
jgi:predicted small lipoprotein YifL